MRGTLECNFMCMVVDIFIYIISFECIERIGKMKLERKWFVTVYRKCVENRLQSTVTTQILRPDFPHPCLKQLWIYPQYVLQSVKICYNLYGFLKYSKFLAKYQQLPKIGAGGFSWCIRFLREWGNVLLGFNARLTLGRWFNWFIHIHTCDHALILEHFDWGHHKVPKNVVPFIPGTTRFSRKGYIRWDLMWSRFDRGDVKVV